MLEPEKHSTTCIGIAKNIPANYFFYFLDKKKHLPGTKDRERSGIGQVHKHVAKEKILCLVAEATDTSELDVLSVPRQVRQFAMELLYRYGGLTNPEIGSLMGVDYSTVSQRRKRLCEKVEKDEETSPNI